MPNFFVITKCLVVACDAREAVETVNTLLCKEQNIYRVKSATTQANENKEYNLELLRPIYDVIRDWEKRNNETLQPNPQGNDPQAKG